MALPSADYRNAMARLGAAVTIVTTDGSAGLHGLTVSAVCSISDNPATLLVCINRASRGYAAVRENGVLCVNVLGPGHADLSTRFASATAHIDERFSDPNLWMKMASGCPRLRDATVCLDCKVDRVLDVGTHGMFICEATDVLLGSECSGLVYFNRGFYGVINSKTKLAQTGLAWLVPALRLRISRSAIRERGK
jgi:flavin reductase